MSRVRRPVVLAYYVFVEYDDESPEFCETLESFDSSDIENLLTIIADSVLRNGNETLIEEIGHVAIKDTNIAADAIWCGVTLDSEPILIF